MKYIFWGIIFLAIYRFWYAPNRLQSGNAPRQMPQEADNGEYTDYEEIKD